MSEYGTSDLRNAALYAQEQRRRAELEAELDVIAMREVDRARSRLAAITPEAAARVDTPEATVYGHGPGYGPDVTAKQLEDVYGTLEERPGWYNAKQFGREAAKFARDNGAGEDLRGGDGGLASQWLMSPPQYEYMQDSGRLVDLLGDLRTQPDRARGFWDRSEGARTTRDDYHLPNYGRFGGFAPAATELFTNPMSPIGGYLRMQNIVPEALKHATGMETDAPGGALGTAYAAYLARERFRRGEVPTLDIPEPPPGEYGPDAEQRYFRRKEEVDDLLGDLEPPTPEELARNVGGPNAPAALGAGVDVLLGMADATVPVSMAGTLARAPANWMMKESTRAAAKAAGLQGWGSGRAARRLMAETAKANPNLPPYSLGAQAAVSRGATAKDFADALRKPSLTNFLGPAARGAAIEEIAPELLVEGAMQFALPRRDRTYAEWAASPAMPEMTDEQYRQHQADKMQRAESAARQAENLERQNPNPIRQEFFRPHLDAERRRFENRDRSYVPGSPLGIYPGAQ